MAVSQARPSAAPRAVAPQAPSQAPAVPLLERAVAQLLHGARHERPSWLCGPLVIVTDDPTAVHPLFGAAGDTVARIWSGPQVGREIARAIRDDGLAGLLARLTAEPVRVIEAIDRLGAADVQRAFVQLFDAAADAGTGWCVTLGSHPDAADLEPPLASRLCGGLIVRVPIPSRPRIDSAGHAAPSLRRLLNAVARHHDLTVADLVGPSRRRAAVHARCIAMYLARHLTAASFYAIGRACGGRDHTTVMHGVRIVERRLTRDPACAAEVARLAAGLAGTTDNDDCRTRVDSRDGSPLSTRRHSRRRAIHRPRGTRPATGQPVS